MNRSVALGMILALTAGCGPNPGSTAPTSPSAWAAKSSPPSTTSVPTDNPLPTVAPLSMSTPTAGVPAAIEQVAWSGVLDQPLADGTYRHTVLGGLLNHAPTIRLDIPNPASYPWIVAAGGVVAILSGGDGTTHVDIYRAGDGMTVGSVDLAAPARGRVAIDPERGLVYIALVLAGGGVELHRLTFDGSRDDVLVRLDRRFTPEGIPTERYDLALDPTGVLLVEACASSFGCRLWTIPADAVSVAPPRTLPGRSPIVCTIVGATSDWLIVQDDAACTADTGDSALPVRAIRRSDGTSHLVTGGDHVQVGRVMEFGGRTYLVGADGIVAGAAVNIVTYDVESTVKAIHLRSVPATPDGQTVHVSTAVLPAPWVLLEPWFVSGGALPALPGRLLDLSTGQVIELPIGLTGWQ